jgi:hypothetical protein
MGATMGIGAVLIVLQDQRFKKYDCEEPSCVTLEWLKLSDRGFTF